MKEYKDRKYRELFAVEGRRSFVVSYKKSDLWIAVDAASYDDSLAVFCRTELETLWKSMESYMAGDKGYAPALVPYPAGRDAPPILHKMSEAAATAAIGPMGAVAGAVAEHIALRIRQEYGCREIIIENGGDIYAQFESPLDIAVFAGESPLSDKIGFRIPAEYSPLGICTSSGTVGPSLSFGKADAVMIVCRDAHLADCYATAFGNLIQTADDLDRVIDLISAKPEILGAMLIKDDRMAITGKFQLILFAPGGQINDV